MLSYNKQDIKNQITIENIFDLLAEFGGEPEYTEFGIVSATICHNKPGEGSRKLYYYDNNDFGIFHCYTGCDSFDVFELVIKVMSIQRHLNYDLNDAVRWTAQKFGIQGNFIEEEEQGLEDWKNISNYERIEEISINNESIVLQEYNSDILDKFNYEVKLPWLNENISQKTLDVFKIGYYPGEEQITIPHFDIEGRFIGLRGRSLVQEEAEKYGKYRPIKILGNLYRHPLGLNLYGLNLNQENIKRVKKAIVFESEKSVLMYETFFGRENNISVACCGSSVSSHQINLLLSLGVSEIIIAFDRQFQEKQDDEYNQLIKKLIKINNKYHNEVLISVIYDRNLITSYKASPIDEGKEKFLTLFKERVVL